MFRSSLLAALLLVGIPGTLAAQQPTEEQRAAVRSACRSDFVANCSGVEPGTKAALMCLVSNEAKLSPACRTAVNAIAAKPAAPAARTPPPAAAEAPPPATAPQAPAPQAPPKAAAQEPKGDQLGTIRQACTLNDLIAHCSWIKPDSPEILLCLKANAAELSPSCQAAVGSAAPAPTPPAAEARPAETAQPAEAAPTAPPPHGRPGVKRRTSTAPPSTPPPGEAQQPGEPAQPGDTAPPPRTRPGVKPRVGAAPPSAPPPAEAQKPSPEQIGTVRAACRSDFMARCRGVQPGTAEALQCLQQNSSQLSGPCRSAVAAIGGGAPPAGSESAPLGAAPPGGPGPAVGAAPPAGPMPTLAPGEAMFVLRACRMDRYRLCGDVPPGGGRILMCLAENAANVSPGCASALAAARR